MVKEISKVALKDGALARGIAVLLMSAPKELDASTAVFTLGSSWQFAEVIRARGHF